MSAVDPMQDMIDNTVKQITSSVTSANSDCVKVMVRADGKIEGIYVTEAASEMSIPQVAAMIANLAEQARLEAVGSVRDAIEQLSSDPRITAACESIQRSMDLPMPAPEVATAAAPATTPHHHEDVLHEPSVVHVEPTDWHDHQQRPSWLVR